MLVQNSVYRNTYLTDGVNKDFYFSFPILESSQVLVQTSLLTNTDVVTTIDPSQYTVTGVGLTTGGHISFTTAPPTGSRIALTLNIPITQLYQYAELDSFPAKSHENALAKLTLICQQLKEQISRAVLISTTSEGSTADIIASLYATRDSANASATAAGLSAISAEASATSAGTSATAAQQSADSAAANSEGLAAEVQNLSTTLIGSIQTLLCADGYVPNGCAPTNAAEYTRAQFPTLYDDYLVAGKLLTCTYAAFAAQVALTGNCAKFALDTINQKFKVPLLKDGDSITQAASAGEIGKSVEAGLPNITGSVESSAYGTSAAYTVAQFSNTGGAITATGSSGLVNSLKTTPTSWGTGLDLNASRSNPIYGNSTTVTDEQIRLRHFVVVASAQNNASVFDWSNYMAGLAGKANVDLSNATGNAIGFYFYARDEKPSGTAGGTSSSGAWHTRDLNTIVYNSIPNASLANNCITLPAGKYKIAARTPGLGVNVMRAALYDVTHSTYLAYGSNAFAHYNYGGQRDSFVNGVFTLSEAAAIELRMWAESSYSAQGLGIQASISGVQEVYSEIEIWKM